MNALTVSPQKNNPPWLLAILLIAKILLQYLVVNPCYDLHRDEYLHLDMANHLAGGYLSVPPLTSWNSLLIQWLGNTEFWVRFFPALYGVLTMLLTWKMINMLGGSWFAQLLAGVAFLCSGMTRIHMFYQPNSVDILAWTIILWLLIKYINNPKDTYIIWIGIVLGVGILNKYNILFFAVGLLVALILTPLRAVFRKNAFYTAIGLAVLIALPNIIWQVKHGYPVLHHMQELAETQLVHNNRMDFITGQLIFFLGGAFLTVAGLLALLFYKPFRPYRSIAIIYFVTILLFVYLKAKSYYSLGLYPALLAFGSTYWEQLFQRWKYMRLLWLAVIVFPFVLILNAAFPLLKPEEVAREAARFKALGLSRWEDGKEHEIPQDFADMLGWREMSALGLKAWQQVPEAEKKHTLVLCDNYGQAGALNYFNKGKMPFAVAMEADYVFWFPKTDTVRYVIKIGHGPDSTASKGIGNIQRIGKLSDPFAREYGWGTEVYLLSGFTGDVHSLLQQRLQKKQQSYMAQ